jgi:hypothetical protein
LSSWFDLIEFYRAISFQKEHTVDVGYCVVFVFGIANGDSEPNDIVFYVITSVVREIPEVIAIAGE